MFTTQLRLSAASLMLAALTGFIPSAQAAVIEQSSGQFDAAISAFDPIGQTFVAEDPLLGSIALAFSRNTNPPNTGQVTMTLYNGSGFTGAVLGSSVLDLSGTLPGALDAPQFVTVDFSGTALTVGQTYTIAVTSFTPSDNSISVVYNGNDAYLNGLLLESHVTASLCTNGCDLNFRVTPAAVPVPAAAWLLGSGLLGLVGFARRRVH